MLLLIYVDEIAWVLESIFNVQEKVDYVKIVAKYGCLVNVDKM